LSNPRKLTDAEQAELDRTLDEAMPNSNVIYPEPPQWLQDAPFPDCVDDAPPTPPRASRPPIEGANTAPDGDFSDIKLAAEFSGLHDGELVHVASWKNGWFRWNGSRWEPRAKDRILHSVKSICRNAALSASPKLVRSIESGATVSQIERLARGDDRRARDPDQFDADPWVLNTPGGIVDLKTGQMRPHNRKEYHTKITSCAPGGKCPTWDNFIAEITELASPGFARNLGIRRRGGRRAFCWCPVVR
jgi:hypothetical protein